MTPLEKEARELLKCSECDGFGSVGQENTYTCCLCDGSGKIMPSIEMVIKALKAAGWKKGNKHEQICKRCGGSGLISVKHGTTYITDSDDEIKLAYRDEPCPRCSLGETENEPKNN